MAELSIDPAMLTVLGPDLFALADGSAEIAQLLAAALVEYGTAAGQPGDQIADAFNANFRAIVPQGEKYMTGLNQLLNNHGGGVGLTSKSLDNSNEVGLQTVNHFRKA